ncbi:MAG: tol-pal system protein YbgF [Chromatiales bacterium]|nr:tol-pal system protein YbgF [Chromatiales bacterium]
MLRSVTLGVLATLLAGGAGAQGAPGDDAFAPDLVLRMQQMQDELQRLRGTVELQGHEIERLKQRQRDLYGDLDQRLTRLQRDNASAAPPHWSAPPPVAPVAPAAPPAPVAPPLAGATPAEPPPTEVGTPASASTPDSAESAPLVGADDDAAADAMYRDAFAALKATEYERAGLLFDSFLARHPNSKLAPNAQYWLAETSYVARDFDRALERFRSVEQRYPGTSKVPDAFLKIGFIHYDRQEWDAARTALQTVIDRFPGSTAARLASRRLDRMRLEAH